MTDNKSTDSGRPARPDEDFYKSANHNETVTAFARAIMAEGDKRVVSISANNASGEWVLLEEAVTSGEAFSAEFRDDIIGFDGDEPDSLARAATLALEMEVQGLAPVSWASGRPGHAQVIVWCPKASDQRWWRARATELGFQWKRRSRPPLSPHRNGHPVGLLQPPTTEEALQRLEPRVSTDRTGRLSARSVALLKNGDPTAPSGSEVVLRIVMGALAKDVPVKYVEAMLANTDNKGGEAYQRRMAESPEAAQRWLHRWVVPKAQEYVDGHPPITSPEDARSEIVKARAQAASFEWVAVMVERTQIGNGHIVERVSPSSLRRGLEGILDLAYKQGSINIALSTDILVRASGLSAPTVRKVRKVLLRQGWLCEVFPHTMSRAGIYRLNLTGTKVPVPEVPRPKLRLITAEASK
jgi:hypothetical protein